MRLGGLAGVWGGIVVIVGFITVGIATGIGPFPPDPPDLEQDLARFPEYGTILRIGFSLVVVGLLMLLPFFAALYRSLREPSRAFARIGLGSGVLAIILFILSIQGDLQSTHIFSALYESAAASDRPVVVAMYTAVRGLTTAALTTSVLFLGLAFVGFGLAMRASPAYQEGLVRLTMVLGLLIVLFVLFIWGSISIIFLVVLALMLGWKVYSLSWGP